MNRPGTFAHDAALTPPNEETLVAQWLKLVIFGFVNDRCDRRDGLSALGQYDSLAGFDGLYGFREILIGFP